MSLAEEVTQNIAAVVTPWKVADRIRKVRREPREGSALYGRRMGQKEFAEAIGVSTQVLSNWEAGIAEPRNPRVYNVMAQLTGYNPAWLAGWVPDQDFSNISDWPILGMDLAPGQMELALDIGPPDLRHVG